MPDNFLGQGNNGDIREKIHDRRRNVEGLLIEALACDCDIPDCSVWDTLKVQGHDIGDVVHGVADEDSPAGPEESVSCLPRYEYAQPVQHDSNLDTHYVDSVEIGTDEQDLTQKIIQHKRQNTVVDQTDRLTQLNSEILLRGTFH